MKENYKSHYPNPFSFTSLTRSAISNWTCGPMTHLADFVKLVQQHLRIRTHRSQLDGKHETSM